MNILKCPVCGQELRYNEQVFRCENRHSYDVAKEGYVNLLAGRKSGDSIGDNKEMALSRRGFLNKGWYKPLAKAVTEALNRYSDDGDSVLDICCGEGYYTEYAAKRLSRKFYGFDLSKNMVRLAAKRRCGATFFVANIAAIPIRDSAIKAAFHLFAPFHASEFSRIIADDGVILTAIPGRDHLLGLKEILYDKPYLNDEKGPEADGLQIVEIIRVRDEITLDAHQDIDALFQMTPYYYHTPSEGMDRLARCESLTTPIEFVIIVYNKTP